MKQFNSDEELLCFAREFIGRHVERFEKDIAICLMGKNWKNDHKVTHAYFPALMACIGFMDFFSGLYSGNLDYPKLKDLKSYAHSFLPSIYSDLLLAILYHCFRHKVAHLAHPYEVLDTKNNKDFAGEPNRRITWSVSEVRLRKVMWLESLEEPELLETAPESRGIRYDHRIHVSIPMLAEDAIYSVRGDNGYLQQLKANQDCRRNFQACMNQYFSA